MHEFEVLLRTQTVTAGNDHARALDIDLALFDLTVDNLHRKIGILHHRPPIDPFHFAGARFGGILLAHHPLADGRHLRTVVGIDDRGNDIAAEGGTNLIEQILVVRLGLGIGMIADNQLRTVGRQAAVQRRRHARREIAADGRSAEKRDLRLLLSDQTAHHRRMGQRAERRENRVVGHPDGIGPVLRKFLFNTGDMVPQHYRLEFDAQFIGQFAAFGQKFQAYVGNRTVFELDIDKYIIHN